MQNFRWKFWREYSTWRIGIDGRIILKRACEDLEWMRMRSIARLL
jgi:hypothetical protein